MPGAETRPARQGNILLLGTGGTIAAHGSSPAQTVGYCAGQIGVQDLLHALPDDADLPFVQGRQVAQIDSKDIDWAFWRMLLHECRQALDDARIAAIVITHGSDTIEETAWLLHQVLSAHQPAHKPVVLTCAMRPPTALLADGAQNLRDALLLAASGAAGVWVLAAGEVHAAARVQKAHPYRLHALRSRETGPAAVLEDGRVRWLAAPAAPALPATPYAAPPLSRLLALPALPWVEILHSGALASGAAVQALVSAGVRGLVVAGSGNATLHQALQEALLRAQARGVRVWRSTRCPEGLAVAAHAVSTPQDTTPESALPLVALPPAQARIAMMLALAGADCARS